jgi:hypothetical protein
MFWNLLTPELGLSIVKSTLCDITNSTKSVPVAGSIICGALAVGVVRGNANEDLAAFAKDGNAVKLAVNTSIVVGSTTVGGVIAYSAMGPVGIGYGMLGGSLAGTYIKRQNHFSF